MQEKILLVSGADSDRDTVRFALEECGYKVVLSNLTRNQLLSIRNGEYTMVVILSDDARGPCQNIRRFSFVPIIVVSKNEDMVQKVLTFEYGADDFVPIPFDKEELKARVKALYNRCNVNTQQQVDNVAVSDGVIVNAIGRKLTINFKEVSLTAKEFDLFFTLFVDPGKVFDRKELLESVWGYEYVGDIRIIDVHIRRIREKLEKAECNPNIVSTMRKKGYYFNPSAVE